MVGSFEPLKRHPYDVQNNQVLPGVAAEGPEARVFLNQFPKTRLVAWGTGPPSFLVLRPDDRAFLWHRLDSREP